MRSDGASGSSDIKVFDQAHAENDVVKSFGFRGREHVPAADRDAIIVRIAGPKQIEPKLVAVDYVVARGLNIFQDLIDETTIGAAEFEDARS
jgi:hypothetical protein